VEGYVVYVENESGERQNLGATRDTSRTVSAGSLPAGIYTVYVGAIPRYGAEEDAQWGVARFGIAAMESAPDAVESPREEYSAEVEETGDGEQPVGDEEEAEQEDADGEAALNDAINAGSDSDTVQELQRQLYKLGVMGDEPTQGVLDEVTLQAVAEFQNRANEEFDAGLSVIDPENPDAEVDADTLHWISRGL
jgi:hypothetical protein